MSDLRIFGREGDLRPSLLLFGVEQQGGYLVALGHHSLGPLEAGLELIEMSIPTHTADEGPQICQPLGLKVRLVEALEPCEFFKPARVAIGAE